MVSNAPEPESVTNAIPPVLRWTFPIGFMGIGLVFLLLGGFEIREGLKTQDWIAASGKILSSEVVSGRSRRPGSMPKSGGGRSYSVAIRYRYEVSGATFEGDRVSFGNQSFKKRSKAQKLKDQYPRGKEVEVFYDPASPNSSVLRKGIGLSWVAVLLGTLLFSLGLIALKTLVLSARPAPMTVADSE